MDNLCLSCKNETEIVNEVVVCKTCHKAWIASKEQLKNESWKQKFSQ
jgi:hypothetical protein